MYLWQTTLGGKTSQPFNHKIEDLGRQEFLASVCIVSFSLSVYFYVTGVQWFNLLLVQPISSAITIFDFFVLKVRS